MFKPIIFIVIFISWINQESWAQIKFPPGFHCDKRENGDQLFWGYVEHDECENTFRLHSWKKDHTPGDQIMDRMATKYGNKITFIPDEYGIYIGLCRYEDIYWYIIIIPNLSLEVQYYSPCNGYTFGILSKWILQEVKHLLKDNGDFNFLDSEGRSCYK